MVKPGQIMRRVFDSVLDAGTNTQRLRGATDNVSIHLGDVNRRTDGIDVFDGKPDMPNRPDRPGTGRNDGRDARGRFVGDGNRPWADREQIGLDNVAEREGVDIIRDQVAARTSPTGDQIRYYDGLFRNADGTYTGVEVKSGSASRDAAQRLFDGTVSVNTPARANLPDVGPISIVNVILERVP
ncbi:hypothetical protein [Microbacterium sp.]|uniref:hypothetical protein n=1 Tax=Microbacterium sp. TaxID=51671 RepID=UPI00261045C1|nr:hypothetical protein [Microbacterium sp.]